MLALQNTENRVRDDRHAAAPSLSFVSGCPGTRRGHSLFALASPDFAVASPGFEAGFFLGVCLTSPESFVPAGEPDLSAAPADLAAAPSLVFVSAWPAFELSSFGFFAGFFLGVCLTSPESFPA